MQWKGFQRPKRVDIEKESATPIFARFSAQPFERGFATTIGNALRRCLLSSIEGAAVTAIHIEGVLHEFSSIPGVVEDVTDIILNLRQVPIRLDSEEAKFLSLDVKGPGTVRAGDLTGDPAIEICDPDLPIATLNEEAHLKMQVQIRLGRSYVTADKNFDDTMGIGWIPIDSVHSPVRRVNYKVEPARVGRATDYERLVLEIHTNGTLPPEETLSLASMLLRDHLSIYRRRQRRGLGPRPPAVQVDRRARPLGALGQLPEERQHQLPAGPGAQDRARDAGDQELRQEVARGAPGRPRQARAQLRHGRAGEGARDPGIRPQLRPAATATT
jgi:DNA-directed RNA polymerase alpha subunit